jgi:hypothetical protein
MGLLVVAAISATATTFAADVTVGGFYTRLGQIKQIGVVDAAGVEAKFRGAGFQLPTLSLDKTLTEGDVAAIATALGVSVKTQAPAATVSVSQADAFLSSYGSRLGAKLGTGTEPGIYGAGTGGIDPGNSGNGKGKKKGHNKSTSEPDPE